MPDDSAPTDTATTTHRVAGGPTGNDRSPLTVAALAVAVLALVLGGWAAFRPVSAAPADNVHPTAGSFDAAQRADATARVCSAFEVVRTGVAINTNATAPGGPEDVTGGIAVGANARLAMLGGGQYLLARIDPAVPDQLATDAQDFANSLMDIGATSISGVATSDPILGARMADAQSLSTALTDQCTTA